MDDGGGEATRGDWNAMDAIMGADTTAELNFVGRVATRDLRTSADSLSLISRSDGSLDDTPHTADG